MNEEQLGQYCRQRGLYPEQIAAWRAACELANDWQEAQSRQDREQLRDLRRKQKELERASRPRPAHALNEAERSEVLAICHKPKYRSLSPAQIVPALADLGRYLASESTVYRILREHDEQNHRGRAAAPRTMGPPQMHTATRPNQVWS